MTSTSIKLIYHLRDPSANAAWERFIELYTPLIYHWSSKRGLSGGDAADLVQDVLMTILQRIGEFDPTGPGRFRGWLRTITLNRVADFYRRQKLRRETEGGSILNTMAEVSDADLWEDREYRLYLVSRTLELLRSEFHDITWQAGYAQLVEGGSANDAALTFGITVNAAYIAKSRLLARLRDELDGLLD